MQLRVGPSHAGREALGTGFEGIFQLVADGLKLVSKEIIVPAGADKPIFWATPILFVAAAASCLPHSSGSRLGGLQYRCRPYRCVRNFRVFPANRSAFFVGQQ